MSLYLGPAVVALACVGLTVDRPLGRRLFVLVLGAAMLNLGDPNSEGEAEHLRDWLSASEKSLREVWDNEEDAVYDTL